MTAHEEMMKRLEKEADEDDPRERVPNSTFLDAATRRNLESFFVLEDSGIGEGQRDCSSASAGHDIDEVVQGHQSHDGQQGHHSKAQTSATNIVPTDPTKRTKPLLSSPPLATCSNNNSNAN